MGKAGHAALEDRQGQSLGKELSQTLLDSLLPSKHLIQLSCFFKSYFSLSKLVYKQPSITASLDLDFGILSFGLLCHVKTLPCFRAVNLS